MILLVAMGSAPSRRYPCAGKQKHNTAAHVQLNGILPPITAPLPHIPPISCAIGTSEPKRDAVSHAKPDIPSKFNPTWPRPALMTGVMRRVPDDELLTTLVRVPFMSHETLKLVCRRFFELVTSESFAIERKAASCQENILVLMGTHEDEINRVRSGVCLALAGDVWIPRRLPYRPRSASAFTVVGSEVFCIGGNAGWKMTPPENTVVAYDLSRNTWRDLPSMTDSRMHPACGYARGCLIACGGFCPGPILRAPHLSHSSCERFDLSRPEEGWTFTARMPVAVQVQKTT